MSGITRTVTVRESDDNAVTQMTQKQENRRMKKLRIVVLIILLVSLFYLWREKHIDLEFGAVLGTKVSKATSTTLPTSTMPLDSSSNSYNLTNNSNSVLQSNASKKKSSRPEGAVEEMLDTHQEREVYCIQNIFGRTSNSILELANLMEHATTQQIMKKMNRQYDKSQNRSQHDYHADVDDGQWNTLDVYVGLLGDSWTRLYKALFDTVLTLNVNVSLNVVTFKRTIVYTQYASKRQSGSSTDESTVNGTFRVNIRVLLDYQKDTNYTCHERWTATKLHSMVPEGKNDATNVHPILLTALRPGHEQIQEAADKAMKQQYNITIRPLPGVEEGNDRHDDTSSSSIIEGSQSVTAPTDALAGFKPLTTTRSTKERTETEKEETALVVTKTTETMTIDYLFSQALSQLDLRRYDYVNTTSNETVSIVSVHRRWLEGACSKCYAKHQFFCFGKYKEYYGYRGGVSESSQSITSVGAPQIENVCEIVYDNITEVTTGGAAAAAMDGDGNSRTSSSNTTLVVLYTDGQMPEWDDTFPIKDTNKFVVQYWLMSHYSNVHYGNPASSVDYLIYHWRLGHNMKPASCYPPLLQ